MTYTIKVYAVEDTEIDEFLTTDNRYPDGDWQVVNHTAGTQNMRTLHYYKIPELPDGHRIISGKFYARCISLASGSGDDVHLHSVGTFDPYTVTWATQPSWGGTALDTKAIPTVDTWYNWNISPLITEAEGEYVYFGLKTDEDTPGTTQNYHFASANHTVDRTHRPYIELTIEVEPAVPENLTITDLGNSLSDTANVTLRADWDGFSGTEVSYIDNQDIYHDTVPSHLTNNGPGSSYTTDSTHWNSGTDIEAPDITYTDTLTIPASDDWYYIRIFSENADFLNSNDEGSGSNIAAIKLYAKPSDPTLTVDENGPDVGEPVTFTLTEHANDTGKVEYYIDFDDGTNSGWVSGGTIKHYYTTNGTYTPVGYVRWNTAQGKTQMISTGDNCPTPNITVGVGAIVAKLEVVSSAYKNDTIILNGGHSYTKEGYITKYEFDPADGGGYDDNGTDPIYTTSFATSGNKTLKVRVTSSATGTPTAEDTVTVTIGSCAVYDLQINIEACSTFEEGAPRTLAQAVRKSAEPIVDDGGKTYPVWEIEYLNVSNSDATNDLDIFKHFRDEDELEFVKFKYDGTNYIEGHILDVVDRRLKGGAWKYSVTVMERAPPTEHTDENYPA